MTTEAIWTVLLGIAVMVNGLLAGASLDQSIEQLPDRHRIGVRAYLAYSRASIWPTVDFGSSHSASRAQRCRSRRPSGAWCAIYQLISPFLYS